jgi:hypothetical protein
MSYMNLHPLVEDLFKAYLSAKLPSINLYRAAEVVAWDQTMQEPCIALAVSRSVPVADEGLGHQTSSRSLSVELQIRTHAEDVTDAANLNIVIQTCRDAHNLLVGDVLDLLYSQTLLADLQAIPVAGLAIQQVRSPDQSLEPRERSYVTTLSFYVLCAPA